MVKTKIRNKTKRHNKKRKTIRRCKSRGGGFTDELRNTTSKTRRSTPEKEITRTINPDDKNRFNRLGRTINPDDKNRFNRLGRSYNTTTQQERQNIVTPPRNTYENNKSPPKFRDNNGPFFDTKFGPSQSSFYSGPSGKYTNGTPIPHGKNGLIIYSTGHTYTGDFNKGKREGTGSLTINDKNITGPIYKGEWKNDKFVPFSDWKNKTQKR
jgi:hypothetical protein